MVQTGIFILDFATSSPLRAAFFIVAIVIAVTIHEFAHAYVASRQGDQTARLAGRVSLNPLAHLDPAGSFLFLLAGIGWGKPVPVNPFQLKDGRRGDFYVSIAGIISNLLTAFVFSLPFQVMGLVGGDVFGSINTNAGLLFCWTVFSVNILLAAFNILPIPPLDGSKAIGIFVPRSLWPAYQRYLAVGPVVLIGLFGLALLTRWPIFQTIIDPIYAAFSYLAFLPSSLLR